MLPLKASQQESRSESELEEEEEARRLFHAPLSCCYRLWISHSACTFIQFIQCTDKAPFVSDADKARLDKRLRNDVAA